MSHISASVVPQEPDPEPISEKPKNIDTDTNGREIPAENADNVEPAPKSLAFKLSFIGLAAGLFVFQMDATALGIAIPTIAEDLEGQSLESFWATSISNAFGRKPPFYVSMALFFVGSIVFAVTRDMNTLIAGRVLQGFGGGGIDVLAEVILADMTTLQERSKYLGLMAIPTAVGIIMGPCVGALFATYVSWRWIGWINLPTLGIGTPLVFFFLKLRPIPLDAGLSQNLNRLDWIGMMLLVIGVTIFVLPLSWAGSLFPWASWQTLLPFSLGLAVLVIFAFYEAKPTAPIIPHRLFHSKTANMTLAGAFIHGAILITLLQYLPLLYQAVQLKTPIISAISLLPTIITSVIITAVSMMLVPWLGGYVWLVEVVLVSGGEIETI